jgi:2-hydroxychromene-2-carboxylate isomerase
MQPVPVLVFFNYRSPYCYLAAQALFDLPRRYACALEWHALGGWDGRSPPDRARTKMPLARQDVARWCKRLGIPFAPPPASTDPTRAGAASLLAQREGKLEPYTQAVMHLEWGEGQDIGTDTALAQAARRAGLDPAAVLAAADDAANRAALAANWTRAQELGVVGVPSFVIGAEIFWGNDRLEFVAEHLAALGAAR